MIKQAAYLLSAVAISGGISYGAQTASQVKLETSYGDIVIAIDQAKAPKTAANFLGYVNKKFYDGTIFHRVKPGFMIQGGGFTPDMTEKSTNPPIPNEADNGLKNLRGTIAMARTGDPNSATAQFFINTVDNEFLNFSNKSVEGWGYCVFGKVIEGLSVVDSIAKAATTSKGMHENVPIEPIVIKKATELKPAAKSKATTKE